MKSKNTKDVGENHIYPFILSNLFVFVGVFFSLNAASDVAILFYIMALNLFIHWMGFYSTTKKKIAHYSEYYNNLRIALFCIAAALPAFLLLFPLVFEMGIGSLLLLLLGLVLSFLIKWALHAAYLWESTTEKLMNRYRMSIGDEREENFQIVKAHALENPEQFAAYIEKSMLFDDRLQQELQTAAEQE